jgi:hypothetical protein
MITGEAGDMWTGRFHSPMILGARAPLEGAHSGVRSVTRGWTVWTA